MNTGLRRGGAAQALRRCDAEIVLIDRRNHLIFSLFFIMLRLPLSRLPEWLRPLGSSPEGSRTFS